MNELGWILKVLHLSGLGFFHGNSLKIAIFYLYPPKKDLKIVSFGRAPGPLL